MHYIDHDHNRRMLMSFIFSVLLFFIMFYFRNGGFPSLLFSRKRKNYKYSPINTNEQKLD